MKKPYTVQCAHAAYYGNIVTVEADTLDEALDKAIQEADGDAAGWRSMETPARPSSSKSAREPTSIPWIARPRRFPSPTGSPSRASRRWSP